MITLPAPTPNLSMPPQAYIGNTLRSFIGHVAGTFLYQKASAKSLHPSAGLAAAAGRCGGQVAL